MHRIFTLLFIVTAFPASGQTTLKKAIENNKLHATAIAGMSDSVFSGSYTVFENRETRAGRKFSLAIIVIPSLYPDSNTTPIFYIEGGPGLPSTSNASFFADTSSPYRKFHDIILVDVRGTGASNGLHCPTLQVKRTIQDHFSDMYPSEQVKACHDSLSRIADLTQYTTTNVVKDLEEVRTWLGYGKINLYGLSYGTRVALVYMKLFPQAVESCILCSPVPSYGRMPLYFALYAQNALELIFEDCRKDASCQQAFPDVKREFNSVMRSMKHSPVSFQYTDNLGKGYTLSISWNAFQTKLRSLMYTPAGIRVIPYIIHEAYRGNFKPFVALYSEASDTNSSLAEGFYLCVTCAEDLPYIKTGEIRELTRNTFMGTYRIDQQTNACAQWDRGRIPDDFLEPVISDIPTLIISGSFDPVTPVSVAREIAMHLSKSTLIIIPGMSHVIDGLENEDCFDNLCVRFIDHPAKPVLDSGCVSFMKPGNYKVK